MCPERRNQLLPSGCQGELVWALECRRPSKLVSPHSEAFLSFRLRRESATRAYNVYVCVRVVRWANFVYCSPCSFANGFLNRQMHNNM